MRIWTLRRKTNKQKKNRDREKLLNQCYLQNHK